MLIPLLGALATLRYGHQRRYLAVLCSTLVLAAVVLLLTGFQPDPAAGSPDAHQLPWPGVSTGIEDTGILFVTATAVLTFLLTLYELSETRKRAHTWLAALLGLEALLMGLFTTSNLLYFTGLASLELMILGYLLETRLFRQFMATGLILLWAATLLLGLYHARISGLWSWELADLEKTRLPLAWQKFAFILMFYAAAIRLAQFPLHTWLPALTKTPGTTGFIIMLTGSKVGLYLLLRFVLPLLPDAVDHFRSLAAGLGVAGIFYGVLLALMQISLYRLLAFVLISQTGMLLVGVFSLNADGLSGSLLLSFNFSLAMAGLFLTADMVLRRTGTLLIPRLEGLFDPLPWLAITFLIATLSTLAMPGTPGFAAAHLLLEGVLATHDWGMAIAVAIGNLLSAAFLLYAFQKIFLLRKPGDGSRGPYSPVNRSETLLTSLICLILLGVGFHEQPWIQWINRTTQHLPLLYPPSGP